MLRRYPLLDKKGYQFKFILFQGSILIGRHPQDTHCAATPSQGLRVVWEGVLESNRGFPITVRLGAAFSPRTPTYDTGGITQRCTR